MNKKFSTLLMSGLLLAGAASAQVGIVNLETSDKVDGGKYFIQALGQKDVNVYRLAMYNDKDSLIATSKLGGAEGMELSQIPLAELQSALWTVSKKTSTSDAHGNKDYYEIKDENGALFQLTLKRKDKADEVLSKWIIEDDLTASPRKITLKAYTADGKEIYYVTYADGKGKGFGLSKTDSDAAAIYLKKGNEFNLSYDQLAEGLGVVKLNLVNAKGEDLDVEGNIFDGKTLKVSDNNDGTYSLQDVADLTKYLGIPTQKKADMWDIPAVSYPDGVKFASSALTDKDGNVIAYSNFVFNYNPVNSTIKATINGNQLAYAKIEGTRVLTVKNAANSAFEVAYLQFEKGTPAALAGGDGVYFIEFLDKTIIDNANGAKVYGKYATNWIYNHTATRDAIEEDEISDFNVEGQWVVKADEDGKYAIVSRWTNQYLSSNARKAIELYAVDEEEGVYTFGNCMDTVRFVKSGVDLANKYVGFKHLTAGEIANNAFGLEVVNNVDGAANYPIYVKNDSLLSATAEGEAFEFKLDAYDEFKTTKGALLLGDTLLQPVYLLNQQYTNNYVTINAADVKAPQQLKLLAGNVYPFSFAQESEDEFKIVGSYSDDVVVFNIKDNVFTLESDYQYTQGIDLFKFADVRAPEYATLKTPGHLTFWSAEGDGKALSYNPTNGWAEVKLASQEPYNEDMFKLWVDTACVEDETRPVYYVATTNTLDAEAIAGGQKMMLVNPIDSLGLVYDVKTGTYDYSDAAIAEYTYENTYTYNIKAMFVPAAVCGHDSLAVAPADTLNDMSVNPAAIAFRTTVSGEEENDLAIESKVNMFNGFAGKDKDGNFIPEFVAQKYYLRVVNNVLVWSQDYLESHLFNVESVETPTANEGVEVASVAVIAGEGQVTIAGAAGKKVVITNILGQTVANTVITSDNATIAAPAGVVVVAVEGENAVKAIVK